jgi:hypothetical protein
MSRLLLPMMFTWFSLFFLFSLTLTLISLSAQELYPEEYAHREADKLRYRYPGVGGESYLDVIERIRPVIIGKFISQFVSQLVS